MAFTQRLQMNRVLAPFIRLLARHRWWYLKPPQLTVITIVLIPWMLNGTISWSWAWLFALLWMPVMLAFLFCAVRELCEMVQERRPRRGEGE